MSQRKKKKDESGSRSSPFFLRRKKKKRPNDDAVVDYTTTGGTEPVKCSQQGRPRSQTSSKLDPPVTFTPTKKSTKPQLTSMKSKSTPYIGKVQSNKDTALAKQQFDMTPVQLRQLYPDSPNGVPPLVNACIDTLRCDLRKEGLFRICGRKTDILELKMALESGEPMPEDANPYAVAGLLSQFLQCLPEPLLTYDLYSDFLKVAAIPDFENAKKLLKSVMGRLPLPNRDMLEVLIKFLTEVAAHSEDNRMDARNLSLVFGASLLNPPVGANFSVMNVQYQTQLIQMMIDNCGEIFGVLTATQSTTRLPDLNIRALDRITTVEAGQNTVRVRKCASNDAVGRGLIGSVARLDSGGDGKSKKKGRWRRIYHKASDEYYYWHTKTGETTWERPPDYKEKVGGATKVFDEGEVSAADRPSVSSLPEPVDHSKLDGSGASTSGDSGAATSGDSGAVTNGDDGAPASGAATSGDSGATASGDSGAATSGDSGATTSGDSGATTSGDSGATPSGDSGATPSGDSCVGESGAFISEDSGAATSGDGSATVPRAPDHGPGTGGPAAEKVNDKDRAEVE